MDVKVVSETDAFVSLEKVSYSESTTSCCGPSPGPWSLHSYETLLSLCVTWTPGHNVLKSGALHGPSFCHSTMLRNMPSTWKILIAVSPLAPKSSQNDQAHRG